MKKQIGFFNVNDAKVKDNTDAKDDQEQMPGKIPPSVMNELEEHIIAKHEYEKSMKLLYRIKQGINIFLILLGIGILFAIFYTGYRYGCNQTTKRYQQVQQQLRLMKEVYTDGYYVGYKDAKHDGKFMPEKHYEIK